MIYLVTAIMMTAHPAATPAPDDLMTITAKMPEGPLVSGEEYAFTLSVEIKKGIAVRKAGLPAPILQLDVPSSVRLAGKVLTEQGELAKNEFLHAPFERLVDESPAKIVFRLVGDPAADDRIAFNVLAYLKGKTEAEFRFVRKRFELPIRGGAEAVAVDPAVSTWGDNEFLRIGARAAPFSLPSAAGPKVSLESYLGRKNVLVTTYRAHW